MTYRPIEQALPVPEHVRSLLCAVAYGWAPQPLPLGAATQLFYGDSDLSPYSPEVHIERNRLRVTLAATFGPDLRRPAPDGILKGKLTSGATFQGRMVLYMGRSFNFSKEQGARASARLDAAVWAVIDGTAPSLWLGQLEGTSGLKIGGNLTVERRAADMPLCGATNHMYLSGAYGYYLVQSGSGADTTWHLIVDTGDRGQPDIELLGRDFLTLQFVLGRQMRLPQLMGVASDRRTVAIMLGCNNRSTLEEHSFPPVPTERNNDEWVDDSWAAVFFAKISAAWRARPDAHNAFWMALDMYLDAMRYHLDADYMRLQIALEAFAYWLLRHENQEERADVKDKEAWKRWVKEHRDEIRAHAVKGREEALYQKVMSVYRLASGRVVPNAFGALALTEEMTRELEERNTVVHQGLMAPDGYDVKRDLRRVGLVRTMLVALVARAVGYGGAINGWETGNLGYPMEPNGWWNVSESDRHQAQQTFIAEEVLETPAT